jgi:hypothetical protein
MIPETKKDQEKTEGLSSNAANEPTPVYLTEDSRLQTPEEHRRDSSIDPRKNTGMEPSEDDLHESSADRFTGSDRAGTAERKDNDMNPSNDEE